jgi:hypothetical protein
MDIGIGIGITATGKSERHEFNEPAIAGSFFYLLHVISNALAYDDDHVFDALLSRESVAVTFMARSGCDL